MPSNRSAGEGIFTFGGITSRGIYYFEWVLSGDTYFQGNTAFVFILSGLCRIAQRPFQIKTYENVQLKSSHGLSPLCANLTEKQTNFDFVDLIFLCLGVFWFHLPH